MLRHFWNRNKSILKVQVFWIGSDSFYCWSYSFYSTWFGSARIGTGKLYRDQFPVGRTSTVPPGPVIRDPLYRTITPMPAMCKAVKNGPISYPATGFQPYFAG